MTMADDAEERALTELADAADEDLGHLLRRAARAVDARTAASIATTGAHGIRPAHGVVFTNLDPDGTRITTLADRAGLTRQAMSLLVRELEQLGYLRTEPDADDGRAVRARLTPAGVELCRHGAAAVRELERHWDGLLGEDGVAALRAALRALAHDGDA